MVTLMTSLLPSSRQKRLGGTFVSRLCNAAALTWEANCGRVVAVCFERRGAFVELWDVYDSNREKVGKTAVRGQGLEAGEYHVVVHIWLVNSEGNFLIQKRAASVEAAPNIWATTGGSALAGENSAAACARELYEEIGVRADMGKARLAFTEKRADCFCDIWIIRQSINIEDCKLQVEEVSEVKWASPGEIRFMIAQGTFWGYRYIEDLFSLVQADESESRLRKCSGFNS